MRLLRPFLSFAIGFGFLYFVLVEVRGFMAARGVPAGYFSFFGKEHQELALFAMNMALHLVPEVILLVSGMAVCTLLLKGRRVFNAAMFAVGAAVSYAFWLLFYQFAAHAQTAGAPVLNWQELLRSFQGPWWASPSLVSPFVGIAIGVWLAAKSGSSAAPR